MSQFVGKVPSEFTVQCAESTGAYITPVLFGIESVAILTNGQPAIDGFFAGQFAALLDERIG